MRSEKETENATTKRKKKPLKWILAAVVVLILLAFFFIPAYLSSEGGRKKILAKINQAAEGQTNFASISMSWFKGVKISDFHFHDPTVQTDVKIKQITAKPHYMPLLTGRLWFDNIVIDGTIIETSVNNRSQTLEISRINSKLNLRTGKRKTDFEIDIAVEDPRKNIDLHADGQIKSTSNKGWTLEGTTGEFEVEVRELDLSSLGPIFALAKLDIQADGMISVSLQGQIKDGRIQDLTADVKGKNLDLTAAQLEPDRFKMKQLDVAIKLKADDGLINIKKFNVNGDWIKVAASGAVPTTFESAADFLQADSAYNLKVNFDCDLAALLSQFGRRLKLKDNVKVNSGRLKGDFETIAKPGIKTITGQASLDNLKGMVDRRPIAFSQPIIASMEISGSKKAILFDKINLSSAFANLDCSGTAEQFKYRADINLEKLQAELGDFLDLGRNRLTGRILTDGRVSGTRKKIKLTGSSQCKNISIISPDGLKAYEPSARISHTLTIEPEKNIVAIDSVKAAASFGQINIEKALLPLSKKTNKPIDITIVAENIDLAKLQPFAAIFASLPKQMQLAGIVQSRIMVKSKNNIYNVKTDSTKIKNFRLIYPQQEPLEQSQVSLTFDADIDPDKKAINVKEFQLISPQIKIQKGWFKKTENKGQTSLTGQIECEYDWKAVSTLAAAFLPPGLKLTGQRKDTLSFNANYPTDKPEKLLASLNTKSKLGFDSAEYNGLNIGPTEIDIQLQNGILDIAPFSTTVNNGHLNFAAQANFNRKPALLKIPKPMQIIKDVQINDTTTKELLRYVNPIFANAVNVTGMINFDCESLAIPLAPNSEEQIEVIGTIAMNNIRLQSSDLLGTILTATGAGSTGQIITIHPTRFVLQNGFLRYDDMRMDIGNNPVNFKGVIGLDKTLDMRVTLPYTATGRTARVDRQTEGKRISLSLKGTLDKPKLDVGKVLEEILTEELEERIMEGLEKIFK